MEKYKISFSNLEKFIYLINSIFEDLPAYRLNLNFSISNQVTLTLEDTVSNKKVSFVVQDSESIELLIKDKRILDIRKI